MAAPATLTSSRIRPLQAKHFFLADLELLATHPEPVCEPLFLPEESREGGFLDPFLNLNIRLQVNAFRSQQARTFAAENEETATGPSQEQPAEWEDTEASAEVLLPRSRQRLFVPSNGSDDSSRLLYRKNNQIIQIKVSSEQYNRYFEVDEEQQNDPDEISVMLERFLAEAPGRIKRQSPPPEDEKPKQHPSAKRSVKEDDLESIENLRA